MISIEIETSLKVNPDHLLSVLTNTAQLALQHQQVPDPSSLTIVLSDDDQLQQLNLQFLGIPTPTDVLSFPAGEIDPESGEVYLGDIIISCQRAQAQAETGNHLFEEELQLLIVHGILHLLGHDHTGSQDKPHMWAAQREILALTGIHMDGV